MCSLDPTLERVPSLANFPTIYPQATLLGILWANLSFQELFHRAQHAAVTFKAAQLDSKDAEQRRLNIFVTTLSGPEATEEQRQELASYGAKTNAKLFEDRLKDQGVRRNFFLVLKTLDELTEKLELGHFNTQIRDSQTLLTAYWFQECADVAYVGLDPERAERLRTKSSQTIHTLNSLIHTLESTEEGPPPDFPTALTAFQRARTDFISECATLEQEDQHLYVEGLITKYLFHAEQKRRTEISTNPVDIHSAELHLEAMRTIMQQIPAEAVERLKALESAKEHEWRERIVNELCTQRDARFLHLVATTPDFEFPTQPIPTLLEGALTAETLTVLFIELEKQIVELTPNNLRIRSEVHALCSELHPHCVTPLRDLCQHITRLDCPANDWTNNETLQTFEREFETSTNHPQLLKDVLTWLFTKCSTISSQSNTAFIRMHRPRLVQQAIEQERAAYSATVRLGRTESFVHSCLEGMDETLEDLTTLSGFKLLAATTLTELLALPTARIEEVCPEIFMIDAHNLSTWSVAYDHCYTATCYLLSAQAIFGQDPSPHVELALKNSLLDPETSTGTYPQDLLQAIALSLDIDVPPERFAEGKIIFNAALRKDSPVGILLRKRLTKGVVASLLFPEEMASAPILRLTQQVQPTFNFHCAVHKERYQQLIRHHVRDKFSNALSTGEKLSGIPRHLENALCEIHPQIHLACSLAAAVTLTKQKIDTSSLWTRTGMDEDIFIEHLSRRKIKERAPADEQELVLFTTSLLGEILGIAPPQTRSFQHKVKMALEDKSIPVISHVQTYLGSATQSSLGAALTALWKEVWTQTLTAPPTQHIDDARLLHAFTAGRGVDDVLTDDDFNPSTVLHAAEDLLLGVGITPKKDFRTMLSCALHGESPAFKTYMSSIRQIPQAHLEGSLSLFEEHLIPQLEAFSRMLRAFDRTLFTQPMHHLPQKLPWKPGECRQKHGPMLPSVP